MPNQQLIEYITKSAAQGAGKEEIKSALLGAGWQEADVNEGLLAVFPVSAQKSAVGGKSKALIATVSALAALLLAGGGFAYWYFAYEPKQEAAQQVVVPQEKQATSQEQRINTIQEESIQDILEKAKNISPVHFTMTIFDAENHENINSILSVWYKAGYLRHDTNDKRSGDEGVHSVIIRPDGGYANDFGVYVKDEGVSKFHLPPGELVPSLIKSAIIIGMSEELVDGKQIIVFEVATTTSDMEVNYKISLWQNTGLPLKLESHIQKGGQSATSVVKFSDYTFENISDEVFELKRLFSASINDVLLKAQSPLSVSYSGEVDSPQGRKSFKTWLRPPFERVDVVNKNGKASISFIMRPERSYVYLSSVEPQYTWNSPGILGDNLDHPAYYSAVDFAKNVIISETAKDEGTEIIDGKECIVISYNFWGRQRKVWVWKEKGVALKLEGLNFAGELNTIMFKDFVFEEISNDMFNVVGTEYGIQR